MTARRFACLVMLFAAAAVPACTPAATTTAAAPAPPAATIPTETPSRSGTTDNPSDPIAETPTSPTPTATATATEAATATRTSKPSPTLPPGGDFACLPQDGGRVSGVVAGVIDGDTIKVQVGFQQFTIRYIGIDAPETGVVPPEPFGVAARSRNRDLVSGERVTLVSDPEVGETDIYDRLLRYVIVDDVFVNAQLVREGLARYSTAGNACGAVIFEAEQEARAENIGIWSDKP